LGLNVSLTEDFAGYVKLKLGNPDFIIFESSAQNFAPFWRDYVLTVSTYLERCGSKKVADVCNALLYKLPQVALAPRKDYFIAFAKNRKNLEDVYLVYNSAYASFNEGVVFTVVPYLKSSSIDKLVKKRANPAILADTLYLVPFLSSIPCTSLKDDALLVKDLLLVRAHSYLTSDDLARNVLGYIMLKALNSEKTRYAETFNSFLNLVNEALAFLGVEVEVKEQAVSYFENRVVVKLFILR